MRILLLNKITQMEPFNRNNKTQILLLFQYEKRDCLTLSLVRKLLMMLL